MNIIINACQSIEKSGQITIHTEFKDDNLIVKIKDNGKGIALIKLIKYSPRVILLKEWVSVPA